MTDAAIEAQRRAEIIDRMVIDAARGAYGRARTRLTIGDAEVVRRYTIHVLLRAAVRLATEVEGGEDQIALETSLRSELQQALEVEAWRSDVVDNI